jgi:2-polyprenyl-6-methoxyphenol hydroxylase-like FAD-dependent oxidoreductase
MNKPTTLDEAIAALIAFDGFRDAVRAAANEGDFSTQYHHSVGRTIRNDWGLWDYKSELFGWFYRRGLFHADDMSTIILEAAYCRMEGLSHDADAKIRRYQTFWRKTREAQWDLAMGRVMDKVNKRIELWRDPDRA